MDEYHDEFWEDVDQDDFPSTSNERGSGSMASDAPALKPKGYPTPLTLRTADRKKKKKTS